MTRHAIPPAADNTANTRAYFVAAGVAGVISIPADIAPTGIDCVIWFIARTFDAFV
jgi:hypothetical protein